MIKLPKLRTKKNGTFYIKFRVKKDLVSLFGKEFISKSLNTNHKKSANLKRAIIVNKYLEIVQISSNSLIDDSSLKKLINEYFFNTLNQKKYSNENNGKCKLTVEKTFQKFKVFYDSEQIKLSTKKQTYKTLELFLELIGSNKPIEDIELYDLIRLKEKLKTLGNRNYKEYKHLSIKEYVKVKDIPEEKRINDGTLKSHIKHIKKLFVFCVNNRILRYNPSENLNVKVSLDKRDAFSQEEIDKLIEIIYKLDDDLKYLYLILIYTGMRRSEVFNSVIKIENGIRYFQIEDSKTINGLRKIPLHSKLDFISDKMFESSKLITNPVNFGAIFNKKIKTKVTNSKRKTLHSIRHYVATKLKQNVANDSMIKAILGHSENDTLNSVYVKEGYSLTQLKESIQIL